MRKYSIPGGSRTVLLRSLPQYTLRINIIGITTELQMNIYYPGIHIIDTATDNACNNLVTI